MNTWWLFGRGGGIVRRADCILPLVQLTHQHSETPHFTQKKSPAVKFIEEVSDSRGRCGLFPPAGCEDEEGMRSEEEGGGGGAEVRQAH